MYGQRLGEEIRHFDGAREMGRIVNTTVDVCNARLNVYHECCVYNYEG